MKTKITSINITQKRRHASITKFMLVGLLQVLLFFTPHSFMVSANEFTQTPSPFISTTQLIPDFYPNANTSIPCKVYAYRENEYLLVISNSYYDTPTHYSTTTDIWVFNALDLTFKNLTRIPKGLQFITFQDHVLFAFNHTHLATLTLPSESQTWHYTPFEITLNGTTRHVSVTIYTQFLDGNYYALYNENDKTIIAHANYATLELKYQTNTTLLANHALYWPYTYVTPTSLLIPLNSEFIQHGYQYYGGYLELYQNSSVKLHTIHLTNETLTWYNIYPIRQTRFITLWTTFTNYAEYTYKMESKIGLANETSLITNMSLATTLAINREPQKTEELQYFYHSLETQTTYVLVTSQLNNTNTASYLLSLGSYSWDTSLLQYDPLIEFSPHPFVYLDFKLVYASPLTFALLVYNYSVAGNIQPYLILFKERSEPTISNNGITSLPSPVLLSLLPLLLLPLLHKHKIKKKRT